MPQTMLSQKLLIGASAALLVLAGSVRANAHDDDHERNCRDYSGPFSSTLVPPPTCTSPIGLCTHGLLGGSFPADYDFTFETLNSANDPNDPTKFVYSGHSIVTPKSGHGVMYTADTGVIHIPLDNSPAPFVTTAVVQSGTKRYTHVSGQFVASGNLDFSTGDAIGSFTALLCRGHVDHDDDD